MIEKDPIAALREAIAREGSVAGVARRFGISAQYIHDVCAGRSKASKRLLDALGLSVVVVVKS